MTGHRREPERVTASLANVLCPRRKRIVVVNDRDDTLLLLTTLLKPAYEVDAFLSGAEALAAISATPPDLVITDWARPEEIDGFELVDRLRRIQPELPVLLVSGYVDVIARPAGVTACLSLPFSARQLSRVVRELIGDPAS
jgi:two-component system C4-dicarboxylate transport response regulator DctD